ncbi:MAG: T9SS type A sorting domain-containing protein [Bacteroidales bacterium]|nr:T9SS type A sorting domain-containing protein [Bacteroidales bacterium]
MKKVFLCFFVCVASFAAMAQSAFVTTGGDASGIGGIVSYTVGQTAYQQETSANGSITEGVQQPYEISVVGIDEHSEITLQATVFPNPTSDYLTLAIDTENTNVQYELFLLNVNGQLLQKIETTDSHTILDISSVAEGIYFLRVQSQNQVLKSFKIVKIK